VLFRSSWWSFKDKIDRRGNFKIAKELGVESLDSFGSPLESFVLAMFAQSPISVYQLVKVFGKDLIDRYYKLDEYISFWENCEILTVKDKKVLIGYTEETMGSIQYAESLPEIPAVRICYDGRGDGWAMCTIKDAEGVDFFKIEDHKQVKFAHKNGFIAKTKERIPLEDVLSLVELAIL